MDLYASLMVTLVCLSTTFAGCPDKCTCDTTVKESSYTTLTVQCEDLQHLPLEIITDDVDNLMLNGNNITVLSNIDPQVENITNLKTLQLSKNFISKIEVNSLRVFTSLENLDLSNNNISNIPDGLFETLPNLKQVLLRNNPYLILPENGFSSKSLYVLFFNNCNLKEIPLKFFDSMPNLSVLVLRDNHISYLGPHVIRAFYKMDIVDLRDNNFTVFQPELALLRQEHLIMIHLKGNPFRCDCQFKDGLQQISHMTCVVPPGSNNNNDNVDQEVYLNSLDCDVSKSEAETITTNTSTSVSTSDISLNMTRTCPDKCNCTKDNYFPDMGIELQCEDLQRLDLELITNDVFKVLFNDNNITALTNINEQERNRTKVKFIDLSNNNISEVEVNSLRVFPSLIFLHLSHNNISNFPINLLKTLPNIHYLHLSNNPYLILPESGFSTKALGYLDIAYCNLKEIPLKFFDSIPHVKHLDLEGNHISYLGPNLITAFQKMEFINLKDNNLTVLQPEIPSLHKEHGLAMLLKGNPFPCDCQFKDGLHQISSMTCVVPPGSNNNNDNVDQEVYLNSLDCDVSKSEAKTITTNISTLVST